MKKLLITTLIIITTTLSGCNYEKELQVESKDKIDLRSDNVDDYLQHYDIKNVSEGFHKHLLKKKGIKECESNLKDKDINLKNVYLYDLGFLRTHDIYACEIKIQLLKEKNKEKIEELNQSLQFITEDQYMMIKDLKEKYPHIDF